MNPSTQNHYRVLRDLILEGRLDEASVEIASLRDQGQSVHSLRLLLSARLAIKNGNAHEALNVLDNLRSDDPFVMAEYFFVRGLAAYHLGQFEHGVSYFEHAASLFERDQTLRSRMRLARFNRLAGLSNLRLHEVPGFQDIKEINELVSDARQFEDFKILGLLLRQRSAVFQELSKLHAALEDAQDAVELLEGRASLSDYNLCLAQLTDVYLDLGDRERAMASLERWQATHDQKLVFVYDFLTHKLNNSLSCFEANLYQVKLPLWERKWSSCHRESVSKETMPSTKKLRWVGSELILESGFRLPIKAHSLEGLLLRILAQGPSTKSLLCESLWPAAAKTENLDDRFHRLISRLNKKYKLIRFDGARYAIHAANLDSTATF